MSSYTLDQADLLIDLAQQKLHLPKLKKCYAISSGKNGVGEQENTGQTPRGWHRIEKKLGRNILKIQCLLHVSLLMRFIVLNWLPSSHKETGF